MTIELWALAGVTGLLFVAVLVQQLHMTLTSGLGYSFSNRRDPPPEATLVAQRLARLTRNSVEATALFTPLVLVGTLAGTSSQLTTTSALVYLLARTAYLPLYAAGVRVVRSLVWSVGFFSLLGMAYATLGLG